MLRLTSLLLLFATAGSFAACGDDPAKDPANVAGEYTVALISRENGCAFANWTEGQTSTGIPVTITQDGSNAIAEVKGAAAVFVGLWLGGTIYQGTVSGNDLELTLYGKASHTTGTCAYTVNSTFTGTLDGDILTGEIRYKAATNGSPDCGELKDCVSRQEFNAIRPPSN
jgi:hypothetical protein